MARLRMKDLKEDLDHLVGWTHAHDEEHRSGEKRLNLILGLLTRQKQDFTTHASNHHGPVSEIKRTASIGALLAVLVTVAEVVRQLYL